MESNQEEIQSLYKPNEVCFNHEFIVIQTYTQFLKNLNICWNDYT